MRSLKHLGITDVIDVGVATGTPSLMRAFPEAFHHLIEKRQSFADIIAERYTGIAYRLHIAEVNSSERVDSLITLRENAVAILKVDVDGGDLQAVLSAASLLNQVAAIMVEATRKVLPMLAYQISALGFDLYDIIDLRYHANHFHQCDLVFVARRLATDPKVFPPHSRDMIYAP